MLPILTLASPPSRGRGQGKGAFLTPQNTALKMTLGGVYESGGSPISPFMTERRLA